MITTESKKPVARPAWKTEFGAVKPLGSHEESTKRWVSKGFLAAIEALKTSDVVLYGASVTIKPGREGSFLSLGFESTEAATRCLKKFQVEHTVHPKTQTLAEFIKNRRIIHA